MAYSVIISNQYRRNNTNLSKSFHKREDRGKFLNSFYESSINLKPKPDNDITRKESCRPASLMNIDSEILSKMSAYQTHQYRKDQPPRSSRIHPEIQHGFIFKINLMNSINIKRKKIYHHLRCRNTFHKIQHPFMVKIINVLEMKGNSLN